MKFAKQLETEAEGIPSEWRPYLIQYKALKKLITKVAEEIESRGLSTSLLHECLEDEENDLKDYVEELPRIRYYFTGESTNEVKPNIEFSYNTNDPQVQDVLLKLLNNSKEETKLEYRRSHENKDFFSLSPTTSVDQQMIQSPAIMRQRRNSSTAILVKELLNLTLDKKENKEATDKYLEPNIKTLVIELEQDDEFFKMLMEELEQAAVLQDENSAKFKNKVSELETKMSLVASPTSKKNEMYNWRQIFALYMDAQIFQGNAEVDRTFRSVERAKKQLTWFVEQLTKSDMLTKLKSKESKNTFQQFMNLNNELITLKHYQMLNQTAMRKILKKHDKRSGLTASQCFPGIMSTDKLFSPKLASLLYASITNKLTTIIPQPEDYACPVCMSVAWRPIRLACNHVFCVRCLIKAQKEKMNSCPMCRHPTAVQSATALNLDEALQNFLKLYFPKEIKDKKKENEREQAIEDVQAMTGRKYSEEQLLRMQKSDPSPCIIM